MMTIRNHARNVRPVLALVAAYAVALQALVSAAVGPFAGVDGYSAPPICSQGAGGGGSNPAPAGHTHDCLAACLAGCNAAPALSVAATVVVHAPEVGLTPSAAFVSLADPRPSATGAHRSRAPPPR